MISSLHYGLATALNIGFGIWAAWQLRNATRRSDSYRRPHLASLAILLVTLADRKSVV